MISHNKPLIKKNKNNKIKTVQPPSLATALNPPSL